jgi:DNA-binding PadR family transcriptional regulator
VTAAGAAELGLAEAVCLTLVAREPRHGWSIVKALAADGEVGRVWSLSRPLTYRALDALAARGYIEPGGSETGSGPPRTIWRATPRGRRAARAWLRRPVRHPRDVRTELLVKLVLGAPAPELARAQLDVFAPVFAGLRRAARAAPGDPVARWRMESAEATRRFLESVARRGGGRK